MRWSKSLTMAMAEPLVQMKLSLAVVEDPVFRSSRNSSQAESVMVVESMWQLMPQDLVETVLLFLPSRSQARFRCVCKRWRKVMGSIAFQKETLSVANRRGHLLQAILSDTGIREEKLCATVHTVDIPGLLLPLDWKHVSGDWENVGGDTRVWGHADLVAVARWDCNGELRCLLLSLANHTWRELPRLVLGKPIYTQILLQGSWNVWLAGGSTNFQVSMTAWTKDTPDSGTLYTCSSTSTDWRTIAAPPGLCSVPWGCALSRRGYVIVDTEGRVWRWEGKSVSPLPSVPKDLEGTPVDRAFRPLSSPDMDGVFGFAFNHFSGSFRLYKLDESCGQWKCLLFRTQLPRGCHKFGFQVRKAEIVGNVISISVHIHERHWYNGMPGEPCKRRILAYNILNGSCEWAREPEPLVHWFGHPNHNIWCRVLKTC